MQKKISRYTTILVVLVGIVFLLMPLIKNARAVSPPNLISYQGRLLDANSNPVGSASANMEFRFYDALTGGTCLWSNDSADCSSTATQAITLTAGLFSENLGDTGASYPAIADSVFADNASVYLEVWVGTEQLTPRKQIVAAPYALNADTLDGIDSADLQLFEAGTNGTYEDDAAVIIGTDQAETLANSGFSLAGNNDLFVGDLLGVEGNIYTDGSFIAGDATTYADDSITQGTAGDSITIDVASGDVAGEDLVITANNVALLATGALSLTPDAALGTAVDLSDTDIATAVSVGANDIVGTTGLINYTNFDVLATGAIEVAVGTGIDTNGAGILDLGDDTATTVNIGTTAATTLNLGAGGSLTRTINIGTGTGADTIQIGGGGTTADDIDLGDSVAVVDITSADFGITLTATTADGLDISSTNTTADTFDIDANSLTSGNVFNISATSLTSGDVLNLTRSAVASNGGFISMNDGTDDVMIFSYSGTPNGTISAPRGSISLDYANGRVYVNTDDGTTWSQLAAGAASGNTLDEAYDEGGAGSGRVITVDSSAIEMTGSNAADYTLEVTTSAAGGALYINDTDGTGSALFVDNGDVRFDEVLDLNGSIDFDGTTIDIDASSNITISTTNDEIQVDTGNQDLVLAGSADGTAALTVTAGDVTVTDGDLLVSDGDFDVTMDPGDSVSITNSATTGSSGALVVSQTSSTANVGNVVGQSISATFSDYLDEGVADTRSGLDITVTNNASDAGTDDNIYGIVVQDLGGAAQADGNEYAIFQSGTTWDRGLYIQGYAEFDSTVDIDGDFDFDGTTFDVDGSGLVSLTSTGAAVTLDAVTQLSIDVSAATAASNISIATDADDEDLTIETTGSAGDLLINSADDLIITATDQLQLVGSDDSVTSIHLDANNAAGDGVTIDTGTGGVDINMNGPMAIDGGLLDVGTCSAEVANGDGDICVTGVLEVDGELELDASLDADFADGSQMTINDDGTATVDLAVITAATNASGIDALNIAYTAVDDDASDTLYAVDIGVTIQDDTTATDNVTGQRIDITNNDTNASGTGLHISANDSSAGVVSAGILIENLQSSDIDLNSGILIRATTDGSLPDAIDVSDAEITNALNMGANNIAGTNASITFAEFSVASGTGSVAIDDSGDLGNLTVEGTTLDINSLDFAGAGAITSTGATDIDVTLGNAANLLQVLTGNLQVGNGTPTVSLDGEDAYIEGTLEVDGAARFDGGVYIEGTTNEYFVIDSDSTGVSDVDVELWFSDDGNNDAHQLVFDDGADEFQFIDDAASLENVRANAFYAGSASTTFGDGSITQSDAGETITINVADGDAAGEDLILTADNIGLLATGALSITPNAALTTAIDLTDTDLTNALSIGDNNIIGTAYTVQATTGVLTLDGATDLQLTATADDILVNPADDFTVTLAADGQAVIDATSPDTTTTAGVLDIDIDTITADNTGINLDYQTGDAAASSNYYANSLNITVDDDTGHDASVSGYYLNATNNDGGANLYGVHIADLGGTTGDDTFAFYQAGENWDFSMYTESLVMHRILTGDSAQSNMTVVNRDSSLTAQQYLLDLQYLDDGDTNGDYVILRDNNGGDTKLLIAEEGFTSWTPGAAGDALTISLPAADTQAIVINSTTTDSLNTSGLIDLDMDTAADNQYGIHLTSNVTGEAGTTPLYIDVNNDGTDVGELLYGTYINIDDDSTGTDDIVHGMYINYEDTSQHANSSAIYVNQPNGGSNLSYGLYMSGTILTGIDMWNISVGANNDAIRIADDNEIVLGNGADVTIEYDEDGTDQLRITGSTIFVNAVEFDTAINADAGLDIDLGEGDQVTIDDDGTATADLVAITAATSVAGIDALNISYTAVDDDAADTLYGIDLGVTIQNDTTADDIVYGQRIDVTNNDAGVTGAATGLYVSANDSGTAAVANGILIENLQSTDIDLANGILVRATTADSIATALNVSDAEITNALSVGANTIVGTTGAITYSGNTVWSTTAGTLGIAASDTGDNGGYSLVLSAGDSAPDAGENGNDVALEAEDAIILESTGEVDIDAGSNLLMLGVSAVGIESTNGPINIANTMATGAVRLGTAGARAISIGNGNATTISLTTDNSEAADINLIGGVTFNDDITVTAGVGEEFNITRTADAATTEEGVALAFTAGAGDGNDIYSALKLSVTSANHAAATDEVYGLHVADLTDADPDGDEYAIYQAGTSWDYGLYIADAGYFDTTLEVNGAFDPDTIDITPSGNSDAIDIVGTNMTSTSAIDMDMLNTSGNLIDLAWSSSTNAANTTKGLHLDFGNLSSNSQVVYGIHIDDLDARDGVADQRGIYQQGTNWDYGLYTEAPIYHAGTAGTASWTLNAGDANISDGSLTLTDADNAVALAVTADSVTTSNAVTVSADGLTTATGMALTSTGTSFNGELLTLTKSGASGSTAFTSDVAAITYTQTFNGGVGLDSTGGVLDIGRSITLDNAGQTHTVSGDVVTIMNSGTQTAGTLTETGDLLFLDENYAANTGNAIFIDTESTGGNAIDIDSAATTGDAINISMASTTGSAIEITDTASDSASSEIFVNVTDAAVGAQTYLFHGRYTDDGEANADFLIFEDNNGNTMFEIEEFGHTTITGQAETTTALQVTQGDLTLSDGQLLVDNSAQASFNFDYSGYGVFNAASTDADLLRVTSTIDEGTTGVDAMSITASIDDADDSAGLRISMVNANDGNGAETFYGLYVDIDDNSTLSDDTAYGIYLNNPDQGAGADANLATDAFVYVNQADGSVVVADGMLFNVAAGGLTDAIDASDAQITNALNIGDNAIEGTYFDVAETTGAVTLTQQATGTAPLTLTGIANGTGAEVDINTSNSAGQVIDIGWPGATETQTGALLGLNIEFDNLIDDNTSIIYGIHVDDFDNSNGGGGTQRGLFIEGTNWDHSIVVEDDISIGAADLGGTTATITFTDFTVGADGNVAISPDGAGDALLFTLPANTDTQAMVVNHTTSDATDGVVDLNITTDTGGVDGIEINYTVADDNDDTTESFAALSIIGLQNSDDATNDDNLYGIFIADLGGTGAAAQDEYAFYQKGSSWDAAIYVEDLVEIQDGTPGTPATVSGGGDIYIHDALEIDGANSTTTDIVGINSSTLTNGNGIQLSRVDSGVSDFTSASGLLSVIQGDNEVASTGDAVYISQAGTGQGIYLLTNDAEKGATGSEAIYIDWEDADANERVFAIESNNGGADNVIYIIQSDGDVLNEGGNYNGGADFAEYFYDSTGDLVAGEVVTVDSSNPESVRRSNEPLDSGVIGVVSTRAAFVSNWSEDKDDNLNWKIIALAGQVPVRVSDENGQVEIGDYLTSASTPGYAMKATEAGQVIGRALQAAGPGTDVIVTYISGEYYTGAVIASDGSDTLISDTLVLDSLRNANAGDPIVDSQALVLRGSVWNGANAVDQDMRMATVVDAEDEYRLAISNTMDAEVVYVTNEGTMSVVGDMIVGGHLYPSDRGTLQTDKYIYYDGSGGLGGDMMRTNASGWSTGSYDFAEMFPSSDDLVAGEVVVFADSDESMRRSDGVYDDRVAGIVSTKPGFLAGENKPGDYPVALAGRVPVRVTLENGPIEIGDPLTTSSTPGYAMKATEAGPIVGNAMNAFDGSGGDEDVIVAFVNVSYYGGEEDETTPVTQTVVVGGGGGITDQSLSGDLYLQANSIIGVSSISGIGERWEIAENGDLRVVGALTTVIESYQGEDVEVVATLSREHTVTLSGTAQLSGGRVSINFEDIDPQFDDIISTIAPVRVMAMPIGEPVALYVANQDDDGFTISSDGSSNAEFNWFVTAYRKDYEPEEYLNLEPEEQNDQGSMINDQVSEEEITEEPEPVEEIEPVEEAVEEDEEVPEVDQEVVDEIVEEPADNGEAVDEPLAIPAAEREIEDPIARDPQPEVEE